MLTSTAYQPYRETGGLSRYEKWRIERRADVKLEENGTERRQWSTDTQIQEAATLEFDKAFGPRSNTLSIRNMQVMNVITPSGISLKQLALNISDFFNAPVDTLVAGGVSVQAMVGHFDPTAPGVGTQFLENAATYDARYLNIDASATKIGWALDRAGVERSRIHMIMDVGSGSGNSVFALAHLFPQAQIIASDLSPEMVAIMQQRGVQRGVSDRLAVMVADASRLEPLPGSFDLIVGSSMLHHLIDPFAALGRLLVGLRPGGLAVFYEPFQAGNLILRQCLGEILRRAPYHADIAPEILEFIRVCVLGLDLMLEEPRVHPVLPTLDDKWMFTKAQFIDVTRRLDLPAPLITTTNALERTWEERLTALLRSGKGREDTWPDWIVEVLRSADKNVSPSLREEMLMEGEILFRGPARNIEPGPQPL